MAPRRNGLLAATMRCCGSMRRCSTMSRNAPGGGGGSGADRPWSLPADWPTGGGGGSGGTGPRSQLDLPAQLATTATGGAAYSKSIRYQGAGTYTFTPPTGCTYVEVSGVAPGGGGGQRAAINGGNGGGSGETCSTVPFNLSGPISIVIGAVGAGAPAGLTAAAGGDGGNVTVGTTIKLRGGKGGGTSASVAECQAVTEWRPAWRGGHERRPARSARPGSPGLLAVAAAAAAPVPPTRPPRAVVAAPGNDQPARLAVRMIHRPVAWSAAALSAPEGLGGVGWRLHGGRHVGGNGGCWRRRGGRCGLWYDPGRWRWQSRHGHHFLQRTVTWPAPSSPRAFAFTTPGAFSLDAARERQWRALVGHSRWWWLGRFCRWRRAQGRWRWWIR